MKQTRLLENFQFGITDPTFNSPCMDINGLRIGDTTLIDPAQCASPVSTEYKRNPSAVGPLLAGLFPFDLTRGGQLFTFTPPPISISTRLYYRFYHQGIWLSTWACGFDNYDGLVRDRAATAHRAAYNIKRRDGAARSLFAHLRDPRSMRIFSFER